jgi:hypothetical protein
MTQSRFETAIELKVLPIEIDLGLGLQSLKMIIADQGFRLLYENEESSFGPQDQYFRTLDAATVNLVKTLWRKMTDLNVETYFLALKYKAMFCPVNSKMMIEELGITLNFEMNEACLPSYESELENIRVATIKERLNAGTILLPNPFSDIRFL